MITCDMQGGLGNIMFQVAAAWSLAKRNNDECYFDLSQGCKSCTPHFKSLSKYKNNIFHKLNDRPLKKHDNHYSEPHFHYTPIPYKKDLFIHGYYQSYRYFDDFKEDICDLFTLPEDVQQEADSKYCWNWHECVSMHIRRGDYLKFSHVHKNLDYVKYWKNCEELFPFKKIVMFSDDPQWAKKSFRGDRFIIKEDQDPDYIDMYYMSKCQHNIIANSTFSWWAAYLNRNEDKKVVAPIKWFNGQVTHDTKDLYPNDWIKATAQ